MHQIANCESIVDYLSMGEIHLYEKGLCIIPGACKHYFVGLKQYIGLHSNFIPV